MKLKKQEQLSTLEDAVKSLSEEQAKNLLLRLAKEIPNVAEQLTLEATGTVTPEQIQEWMKKIADLTAQYRKRSGYMDYRTSKAYSKALRELLKEKVPLLMDSRLLFDAFMLTVKAFSEAYEADLENTDALFDLFGDCWDYWETILPEMTAEEYEGAFDWLLEHYGQWLSVGDSMEDLLFRDRFQEEAFLRKKLAFVNRRIAEGNHDDYDRKHLEGLREQLSQQLSECQNTDSES